ncbi:MAG: protein kinase [Isosphaeraceae bacterium]|nr:protein kinase [Isosphaeraceae bacterium]
MIATLIDDNAHPAPTRRVRYVGDYELLSVLGQGGMGVVYRARQVSLNRLVAVKMIRNADFASEEQLRRFALEAESVAHLDHPGIVPIYEIGRHEDQRYFSMKLIEGSSLEKRLPECPAHPRRSVELVVGIADAISHAHQRGILHRDLKPANVLIDDEGRPHVTDFGLAKRIQEDDGLSASGTVLGTPAYMSPEQALGRVHHLTTSTDVYGLGAILYAVLTGHAPFSADSALQTLEQVRHTPPVPPSRRNATLPKDLEVITLKCLEKEASRRYPTARELADDLQRWLDGKPIRARAVSPLTRTWMWCKRNPVLASVAAALIATLIVGTAGITLQWREAVRQRELAIAARDDALAQERLAKLAQKSAVESEAQAQAARTVAENNARLAEIQATLALGTIQRLVLLTEAQSRQPGMSDFSKAVLDTALASVVQVSNNYEKSTSKEATTAAIHQQLGGLFMRLGQSDKALAQYKRVLEIAKERVVLKEGSDPARSNLAAAHFALADVAGAVGRDMAESLGHTLAGHRIWQEIYEKPKADGNAYDRPRATEGLAEAAQRLGIAKYRLGDLADASRAFRQSLNLRLELADAAPNDVVRRRNLAYSYLSNADVSFRLGDDGRAVEFFEKCLAIREQPGANPSTGAVELDELSAVQYMYGDYRLRKREFDRAEKLLESSRSIRQDLVDRDPKLVDRRRALGLSLYRLGNVAQGRGDSTAARTLFDRCLAIRRSLAENDPANDRRKIELMLVLAHVGDVSGAAAIADRLASGPKVDNELRTDLARCYAACASSSPAEPPAVAESFRSKAIEQVRLAVAAGYRDRMFLATEPDLAALFNDPAFLAALPPALGN